MQQTDNQQNMHISTGGRVSGREFWNTYRKEVFFFICLSALTVLSHWLSRFIPVSLYDNVILLFQHGANTALCLIGAWLLFSHSDGMRIRRACGYAMVAWGFSEMIFLLQVCCNQPVLSAGEEALSVYMLFAGNFLGWLLLLYPTETLRPGWMTWKIALWQLLPLTLLCVVDYFVPLDLRWLISLYPIALFILILSHIRAYRIWCENNYSSMEHIDVQWIVRYLNMLFVMGVSYGYMMVSDNPCRAFTQNLLVEFMFAYSIVEILFRNDPWLEMKANGECEETDEPVEDKEQETNDAVREKLEQWLDTEKPYLRTDFKLIDLMEVLPMNRTYLSQFINTVYGCTFYQFVSRYRVEEAKRLMREHPDWKLTEIAARSGFSSPVVFSHTFFRETGVSPREWSKNETDNQVGRQDAAL